MSLYKEVHFSESNFFEFRSEAFTVGNSNYRRATAATDPRILEFALRYHF